MPQRPESEAEPEQGGGSTDSPPAHDHVDGHESEDGLEVMQQETLVGGEEASTTTAPPAATDEAVDEGVPRPTKVLGTGGEFARRDRRHSTSKRPPDMLSEELKSLSPKQRLQAFAELEAKKAAAEAAKSSSSSSSRVAMATPSMDILCGFPRMPTDNEVLPHRDKITIEDQFFNAAVARTVPKKELYSVPEAQDCRVGQAPQEWLLG